MNNTVPSERPSVKPGLDAAPRPVALRHAGALIRKAERIKLAVLSGDRRTYLGGVALVPTTKRAALAALAALKSSGAKTVLLSSLDGTLTIGATSLLPLLS